MRSIECYSTIVVYTPKSCFSGRLLRGRLQHGLCGERQFLRHEVCDHVGPSPHVLPSLVVVVRALDLQLKPLRINVRQTFHRGVTDMNHMTRKAGQSNCTWVQKR